MAVVYSHDSQNITIQNCIGGECNIQKLKLPKASWAKKLEKINKKIKKFNIDENIKWVLSINGRNIDPKNAAQFENVLSVIPPPIDIKIKKVYF